MALHSTHSSTVFSSQAVFSCSALDYIMILFHIPYSEIPRRQLGRKADTGSSREQSENGKVFNSILVKFSESNYKIDLWWFYFPGWYLGSANTRTHAHMHVYMHIYMCMHTHTLISQLFRVFCREPDATITAYLLNFYMMEGSRQT